MAEKLLPVILAAMVLSSAAGHAAKRGLPEQVIPECFGVNIHFTGDNDKEVKQIAEAGFKFIRMDFHWNTVEKEKGKYDFSAYDGLMAALDRHGIRPLFILDYGNSLYDEGLAPCTDEGRKAFAAFAGAAASHFKNREVLWEIWNEPNIGFWRPKPNAQHYALLANITAKAIHLADPDATVLAPALAGTDLGFLEQIFQYGVLKNIDVVSIHPYRGQHPETAAADYKAVRAIIDRCAPKGKQIPIVSGEWGYSAVELSVDQQAQFLVRQFLTNLMCGVKLSIWYDWHDDGQDPKEREHHFGTVYWDFSPKPAYTAVQALAKELRGYRLVDRLYIENANDYVLLFKNSTGDYKLAAWTTDSPHQVQLPLDSAKVILVNLLGKPKQEKVLSETLKLELSPAVAYVGNLSGSKRLAIEEALRVEPKVLKQSNAAQLPALVRLTNPLAAPLKVLVSLRDPSRNRVIDTSTFQVGAGKTASKPITFRGPWNGNPNFGAAVEVTIEGVEEPFRRMLIFDTSRRFTVTSAPPARETVLVRFSNPSGEPFSGKVMLSSGPGMTVAAITVPVKLEKGQTSAEIRYPVMLGDRKQYTFRILILDDANDTVYALEDRTYRLVEAFDTPERSKVVMDGDAKVPGSADLSTSDPPQKLMGAVSCTRIGYKFGSGWKFARLVPQSELPINAKPKEVGVWVYGDKSGNYVRARFLDSTGQCFQPHLATVDWEGWRFVTCPIEPGKMGSWGGANDGIIHWPIKWNTLFLLDSTGGREQNGDIYIGPLWLMY